MKANSGAQREGGEVMGERQSGKCIYGEFRILINLFQNDSNKNEITLVEKKI